MTARRLPLVLLPLVTSCLLLLAAGAPSPAGARAAAAAAKAATPPAAPTSAASAADADVAAARALFAANLQAIRDRDAAAYLACYLDSANLARTGAEGFALGFAGLAADAGKGWPDHIAADDVHLVPVLPGLVYGTYRYRVRYGTREVAGPSERRSAKPPAGWKIAVSTAFQEPPATPPPARVLAGATLLDGTGAPPVANAVVVLSGGKIDCAGPRSACPIPAGADVLDVSGLGITPGVIDAHVHFSQTGWAHRRPRALGVA